MLNQLLNIDLVTALGLDKLPEEERNKIVNEMEEVVSNRVNTALLAELSEEQKKELDTVLEQDGDVIDFFIKTIPNAQLIASEVVANFKQEMLNLQQTVEDAKQTVQ